MTTEAKTGMKTVDTRDLGLAAFIKMGGGKLISCDSRTFKFESELSKRDWELAYGNSCCRQHDAEVVYFRSLLNT